MKESELALSREIGERLRTARRARGLSLNELSALTDRLYSKSRISNYEQGLRRLSVEGAQVLARALGNVSAAYLLCLDGESGFALSADELELLETYRRTDPDGRRRVLDSAEIVVSTTPSA
jgi:transcriptional regulator with XRE-family HTH domain